MKCNTNQNPINVTHFSNLLSPYLPTAITTISTANADTGTTGHYISPQDTKHLTDIQPTVDGITVQMPNGTFIKSSHTGQLNLPSIPSGARTAHVFPDLKTGSLLSIGILCDHGLRAIYDKDEVSIYNKDDLILSGKRSPQTRLWMIDLNNNTTNLTTSLNTTFSAY